MNHIFPVLFLCLTIFTSGAAAEVPVDIRTDQFIARFYDTQHAENKPVVMVLGGSEGGYPDKLAKPIADAGFKVLSLAYFKEPDLPAELEKIPLEYFYSAIDW